MRTSLVLSAVTFLFLATAFISAQEAAPAEEVLTGCLNPTSDESFELTVIEGDQAGKKIRISGDSEELATHAKNHTVKVTGVMAKEQGEDVFKVSAVEHVEATCQAPTTE